MTIATVADLIEHNEGRRHVCYRDTLGKLSNGVGHCLDTKPLPQTIIDALAAASISDPRSAMPWPDEIVTALRDIDIADARRECVDIFGDAFEGFGDARQACLTDMAFELGEHGLRAFSHMIAAIAAGDWETAAAEALSSQWASQVPARAKADASMLRSGEWPTS